MKKACTVCKIIGILVVVGALNWGLVGVFGFNLVESLLGSGTLLTKIVYSLVGIAGVGMLVGFFKDCPKCK